MALSSSRRPDGVQKIFLWLIICGWALLCAFAYRLESLSNAEAISALGLLCLFHVLLVSIAFKRTRRLTDGYIIYPLIGSAIGCLVLIVSYALK